MIKKILGILSLIIILVACVYFFYIRERYIDVLHTEIVAENFTSDNDGVEDMIDWYYKTYHVPAISAVLIENGKVSRYISRGTLNKKSELKADENTIYQVASLSKMLTGIIANSLELQGLIDIDKAIVETLGEELSDACKEKLKDITLRNVLYHNSGLGRSMKGLTKAEIIESLETTSLEFETGSKWQYSNYGYALISLILEKETGKTYQALLSEYVKNKYNLEICDAGLGNIDQDKLAIAYWKHFKVLENEVFDFGMQNAASGVFCSAKSLSNLMIKQIADYQLVDSLKNESPLFLNRNKINSYGEDGYYGYGLFENSFEIDYDPKVTNNYLFHGGDADGYVSNYGFFPKYGIGIIVLSSSGGPWFWDMERKINAKIIEEYLKKK